MDAPASRAGRIFRDARAASGQTIRWRRLLGVLAISVLALAVHGYHYGIEDEAIYLPAVKQHLDETLYPFDSRFFESQSRLMLFDEFMASLSVVTRVPLNWVFFSVYCLSTFLLVLVMRQLAERFFRAERARWAAVLLPAALLTLPVAGTALFIMDQHLHPRNLATIALLFALVATIDRRMVAAGALAVLAAAFHPLMALFGVSLASIIAWRALPLHFAGFALILPLAWFFLPPGTPAWRQAADAYLFLTNWAWYEWLGIFGPMILLAGISHRADRKDLPLLSVVSRKLTYFGLFYFVVAAVITFTPRFETLATLQPMRSLQLIYLFLFFFVGGFAGQTVRRRWTAAALLFLGLCGAMFYVQRREFPASPHIEWPGHVPDNAWLKAFDWVRLHTPRRAYFVMDPRYLERPGQDFHGFRALAERSMLADQIKDRAAATFDARLAEQWMAQSVAQQDWRKFTLANLRGLKTRFGVDWVVLERAAPPFFSELACPYENELVRVCRID